MAAFGVPIMLGARAALALATEIQALLVFRKRRSPARGTGPGGQPLREAPVAE
jgi:hypothetical protein